MGTHTHTHTYHDTPSQDTVRSFQRDLRVNNVYLGLSICIGHDVAKITGMPVFVCWSTMLLLERVEVRSSTHAACSVVSELVNVEAVCAWFKTRHFTSYPRLPVSLQKLIQTV